MKKAHILISILTLALCSSAISCSSDETENLPSDTLAYNLNTTVDSISVRNFKAVRLGDVSGKGNQTGGPEANFNVVFDGKGNIVGKRCYDDNGTLISITRNSRSEDGNECKESYEIPGVGILLSNAFKYENGRLTAEEMMDNSGKVLSSKKYTYNGEIISSLQTFDADGNMAGKIEFSADASGNTLSSVVIDTAGTEISKTEYTIEEGRLVKQTAEEWEMQAEYDGGLVTKVVNGQAAAWSEKTFGFWNSLRNDVCQENVITIEYSYEFDDKGNWVKRTASRDGIVLEIMERTIFY